MARRQPFHLTYISTRCTRPATMLESRSEHTCQLPAALLVSRNARHAFMSHTTHFWAFLICLWEQHANHEGTTSNAGFGRSSLLIGALSTHRQLCCKHGGEATVAVRSSLPYAVGFYTWRRRRNLWSAFGSSGETEKVNMHHSKYEAVRLVVVRHDPVRGMPSPFSELAVTFLDQSGIPPFDLFIFHANGLEPQAYPGSLFLVFTPTICSP